MTGVKAEWHLGDLTQQEADPFGMVIYSPGVEIDLTSSEEVLVETMGVLWRREERMARRGLACEFKDAGQDCRTCSHATLDPTEERNVLCRLGKDEVVIDARYEQLRAAREASVTELVERVDEATEIGTLSPELEDLLIQVGA